jgi:hypothetical protein
MAEEEREGLTDFRRHAALRLRHDLAVAFAKFGATHFAGVSAVDKDPERYVRDVEQEIAESEDQGNNSVAKAAAKTDGSLGIGRLHNQ